MKPPKPLADLLPPALGPALAAQGFTGHDIVAAWPEIVGERLAARSRPIKLEWPRRRAGEAPAARPAAGTLVLRVEGAFALEVQHEAALVLERVNAVFGWRCVERLVLKQGPVGRASPSSEPARPPSPAALRAAAAAARDLADPALGAAVERLGRAVLSDAESRAPAGSGTPPPQSSPTSRTERVPFPGDDP